MGMAAVIYKKGAPDNFVWEKIKVGSPECGQIRLRSTAVGVNFADTYHRAGIPHPMIVGDRIATRYDKLAANYLAFIKLASIRIWLHAYESAPLATAPGPTLRFISLFAVGTLFRRLATHAPWAVEWLVSTVRSTERFIGTSAGLNVTAVVRRRHLIRLILRCGCLCVLRVRHCHTFGLA